MTPTERTIRLRLREEFLYYAPRCLKIRTKRGAIEPLRLNDAQRYLHAKLEEQKARTGKVRALTPVVVRLPAPLAVRGRIRGNGCRAEFR